MKTIKQKHTIKAEPEDVFNAITNPVSIELWSGYTSDFKTDEGYEFSIFDGDINGRNVKFIPGELIEQEWYLEEGLENSKVKIVLKQNKTKTDIELTHENIPDDMYEEINNWWKYSYWEAVKKFF